MPYQIISSGNCALNGMTMISNKQQCNQAAKELNLEDITSSEHQSGDRAHGCLTHTFPPYLVWAPTESHPHDNVPCGENSYNCICVKSGKIPFALMKYKCMFKIIFLIIMVL